MRRRENGSLLNDLDTLPVPKTSPPLAARIAVSLAFFINGAAFACWVSRIPVIRHNLSLTDGQLGLALLGTGVGALIGFPISGALCARYGNKPVTIGFGFGLCAILALIPLAHSLAVLTAILTLFGMCVGAMDVAMNANGVDVERIYGRSIMSSLHGTYSLGNLTGAMLGLVITKAGIGTGAHLVGSALLLAAMLGAIIGILNHTRPDRTSREPVFALPSRSLLAVGAIVTCSFLCEGAMGDWSGVYMRDTLKTSPAFAVSGYVAYSLMMTIARFKGDAVLTRFGAVRVLQVSGAIAATGFGAALIFGNPIAALIGFGCIGLGMSTIAPIGFSAAGRTKGMPSGSAIAAVATMGYSGFLVGPPIIGLLAEWITLRWSLGLIALLSLLIVALAPNAARDS